MSKPLILNPEKYSWVSYDPATDFPIQNLPLGVYRHISGEKRICTRIGDKVLDLYSVSEAGVLKVNGFTSGDFKSNYLNGILQKGKESLRRLRSALFHLLASENGVANRHPTEPHMLDFRNAHMELPLKPANYTDFYSSREHATNVGMMFRDPANALLPNWLHLPVAYHGRASSIVVSGTNIHRPKGQMQLKDGEAPVFGPTKQLDFELEMAFVVGKSNPLGQGIPAAQAEEHIQGMLIFNDWSARDIQKWEYIPLGPFLAKNFGSSVSAWLVDLDALQAFKTTGPIPEKPLLDYLKTDGPLNYDIHLEVFLETPNGEENLICKSNMKYLYWNMSQQLAHHTVNGCNMEVGDLCASGTISGSTEDSFGSMLELAWKGTKPLKMKDGTERTFVQDGDSIIMRAYAHNDKYRIGFGEVRSKILPAKG